MAPRRDQGSDANMRLFCLLGLLLAPTSAAAQPAFVKLSWAGPDAATTMAVSWVTPSNQPTVIEYGRQNTNEHVLTGPAPQELPGIGWVHEIELTGLTPNEIYRYRVGGGGQWSAEYTFKTAPDDQCTPFTFVSLGDARSQNDRGPSLNWASIHQEAADNGAAFIINGGDLVIDGARIEQWAQWLQDSAAINPLIPMMPAIGNHDDGPGDGNSANYNRLFFLPTNPVTGTEDYFYFVYNNLLVFSLSTQTFDDWGAQMSWMQQVAAQHPDKWKIAYFHHPVYTTQTAVLGITVGHPPNEKNQNPTYAPAFDAVAMDVVVQSHNHIYERFRPLRWDPSDPEQGQEVPSYGRGPNEGRLYLVSGGSGAFLDPLIEGNFQDFANGSESRSKDHHFLRISVAGATLQLAAIRTTAGNSSGGGTVIDQVTLTRPGADPCNRPGDPDNDGDGYPISVDCDDGDPAINPGAAEVCGNSVDEDCSRVADPCPPPPEDQDGDGSPLGTDCDDTNPDRYPEHPETECDGIDNDCDCLENCNGILTDFCVDAGSPDATLTPDVIVAPDATLTPDAGADAAVGAPDGAADSGLPGNLPPAEGCGCQNKAGGAPSLPWVWGILILTVRRRFE